MAGLAVFNRIPTYLRGQLVYHWRLVSYLMKDPDRWPPRIVYFGVTSACNMKCKMCDVGQGRKDLQFSKNMCSSENVELPLPVFKKVIDQIASFRPQICIVATEPLLYRDILPALKYVKEKGLELSLTTNGLLLDKFATLLSGTGLDDLWVSLDGTSTLNDFIRGVAGAFDRAVEGIGSIQALKRERNAQIPKLHINFTISDLNCGNLIDFVKEMLNQKVDSINLSHLNYVTEEMSRIHNERFGHFCMATPGSVGHVHPENVDLEVLHRQIKEIVTTYPMNRITFTPDLRDRISLRKYYLEPSLSVSKSRCLVPWSTASVQPNGDMIVLTRCLNYRVGNIMKQDFFEIWTGPEYRSFRKELWKNRYFPVCTRCCGIL